MKTQEYIKKYFLNAKKDKNGFVIINDPYNFINDFIIEFETLIEFQKLKSSDFTISLFDTLYDQMETKWSSIENKCPGLLSKDIFDFFKKRAKEIKFENFPDLLQFKKEIKSWSDIEIVDFFENSRFASYFAKFDNVDYYYEERVYINDNFIGYEKFYSIKKFYESLENRLDEKFERFNIDTDRKEIVFEEYEKRFVKFHKKEFYKQKNKYESDYQKQRRQEWKDIWEEKFKREQEEYNKKRQYYQSFFDNIFRVRSVAPVDQFKILGITDYANSTESEIKKAFNQKILIAHPDKGGTDEKARIVIEAKQRCLDYIKNK